jgi:hypothetical protein
MIPGHDCRFKMWNCKLGDERWRDGKCNDDDCDVSSVDGAGYEEGHELFGLIRGRNLSALSNRHSYFHYCKSYVLYAWHMLKKHGLLRTSFQMLNASNSPGDGGFDVPSCICNNCDDFGNDKDSSQSSQSSKRASFPRRNTAADKVSKDAMAGLNKLGESLSKMSKSTMRSAKITADSGNIQSLCSTIESLESCRTQLVLLKLDRVDNPVSMGVIDSEIEKINKRLIECTGEYDALMSTSQRRGGTPGLARS